MLTDSFTIKKASPDAADTIAQFQIEMASESENISLDHETVMKGVQYIFQKPDLGFYLVAYDSRDKMAGCLLILKEWSDWRNADVWWLHSVFVVPDHRRRGIFSKMFEFIESLARSTGIAGIRLYVDNTNDDAKQVYTRLGFDNKHYELFEKMF